MSHETLQQVSKASVIEIFASIQGEGLWAGKPQVFVRFHGCRLQCTYCDTPLTHHKIKACRIEEIPFTKKFINHDLFFSADEIDTQIAPFGIHSLALTGGEPLEQADFIAHWLAHTPIKYEVLLETNGVEIAGLKKVKEWVQLISMDIKVPSSSGEKALWSVHQEFIQEARGVPLVLKIVYDESLTEDEFNQLDHLFQQASEALAFVFQPVSPLQKRDLSVCLGVFWRFAQKYPQKCRLLPQIHKFLSVL